MPTRRRRFVPMLLLAVLPHCSEPFEAGTADAQAGAIDTGAPDTPKNPTDRDGRADDATDGTSLDQDAPQPPVTQGLLLWLRADAGVTQSVGVVSDWADQSGHHQDARQTDPSKQPKWIANALSGHPSIVFDGDDFMSIPSGFGDFTSGISIFAVAFTNTTGNCVDILDLSNGP